ncbi:MAG: hypothetical protein WBF77_07775 [Sulfurimonadaceae bacterium]
MKKVIFVLMLSIVAFTYYSCDTSSFDSAQRAAERPTNEVVTIYFAGSMGDSSMWQPERSNFGRSETVATLHYFQKDNNDPGFSNHHKIIINGIKGPFHLGLSFKADWDSVWRQAYNALLPILDKCEGECITLNLVGFSRGGISAMRFATKISEEDDFKDRIEKFNILVFDPVPGDGFVNARYFNLPANTEYLGFYAVDERSVGFAPVFPYRGNSPSELISFFTVPGSHETMVGSIKRDGHTHNFSSENEDEDLAHLSRTLKIVATEMLGSSDWGHVRFREPLKDGGIEEQYFAELELDWYNNETDLSVLKDRFNKKMVDIYSYNAYVKMRSSTFFLLFQDCESDIVQEKARCVYYQTEEWPVGKLDAANTSLLNIELNRFLSPLKQKEVDLNNNLSNEEYRIWNLIRYRGSLDVDADFFDYEDDNCPETFNPDQANRDNDDQGGDMCDPDNDNDGVLNESDICPDTPLGEVVGEVVVDPNNGCSLDQLAPCEGPRGTDESWRNHGEYVSTRTKFANDFVKMGLLTHKENSDIVSAAAKSKCGHTQLW